MQNYRYLDLLSVLCVCDGVSIPDNQRYITEAWLMHGQKVRMHSLRKKRDSSIGYAGNCCKVT